MTDVLIIGAGPAGSAAAIGLARRGHEVLLLDRCRFPRNKPCGEFYNPACVRLLRELGVLPAVLSAGARDVPAVVFGAAKGRSVEVSLAGLDAGGESALTLGRETLDLILVNAARAAGTKVWEGALAREPLVEDGIVKGALVQTDSGLREVRARVTLAADGLRSRFARRLRMDAPAGTRRKLGLTARYAAIEGVHEPLGMYAGGPGCCGIALRGGEANLGMVADMRWARAIGGDPAAFFDAQLDHFPELRERVLGRPEAVRTVGPLTWTTLRQSMAGCLLLGDAAGFYDPFTGEGVTFALRSAAVATEVVHGALVKDLLTAERLAEYDRRRAAWIDPRIRMQKMIQAIVSRPWLFDAALQHLERHPNLARSLIAAVADVSPPPKGAASAWRRQGVGL